MELTGNLRRRIVLYSLVALIVPLVAFPGQFGMELMRPSFMNAMYEIVFYGMIVFLFYRRVRLLQLLQAAGTCLVFRFILGAAFGLLVGLVYNMDFKLSVTLGLASYLPAIFLHALATPFIMKPVIEQICATSGTRPARTPVSPRASTTERPGTKTEPAVHPAHARTNQDAAASVKTEPVWGGGRPVKQPRPPAAADTGKVAPATGQMNGFEKAIQYLGEHGSVELACAVDHEGLSLARFSRGDIDPDEWVPLTDWFVKNNSTILDRFALPRPDKVDLLLPNKRVIVATQGSRSVMVVAERQSDEVLNIRINQAMEMISRYVAERYTEDSEVNAEITHVSST